ncbi:MAG: hypothetical protein PHY31_08560 [Smithellaceae bacterium]|nr:hypothetical protein [Smithellaceae bacterium]
MHRIIIFWIFVVALTLVFILSGTATAMAGTKKTVAQSHRQHNFKVVKTGKPPVPKLSFKKKVHKPQKHQTGNGTIRLSPKHT